MEVEQALYAALHVHPHPTWQLHTWLFITGPFLLFMSGSTRQQGPCRDSPTTLPHVPEDTAIVNIIFAPKAHFWKKTSRKDSTPAEML